MQATQRQYFYAPPPTEAVLLVVPEEQLHLFKFYMDNTVCEAMRHSSGLYKLAYEIGTHQDFSQTLGCELSIQGSPIIISIGQNRYRVWVSLQAATTCIATPLQPTEAPRWVKSVPTSAPFEPRLSLSTPPMPLLPDAIAPFPGVVSEKLPDFQAHLPVSTVVICSIAPSIPPYLTRQILRSHHLYRQKDLIPFRCPSLNPCWNNPRLICPCGDRCYEHFNPPTEFLAR